MEQIENFSNHLNKAIDAHNKLAKEVEELEKDALRFRWVRDYAAHTCSREEWVKWVDRNMLLQNPPKPMNATHSG